MARWTFIGNAFGYIDLEAGDWFEICPGIFHFQQYYD